MISSTMWLLVLLPLGLLVPGVSHIKMIDMDTEIFTEKLIVAFVFEINSNGRDTEIDLIEFPL